MYAFGIFRAESYLPQGLIVYESEIRYSRFADGMAMAVSRRDIQGRTDTASLARGHSGGHHRRGCNLFSGDRASLWDRFISLWPERGRLDQRFIHSRRFSRY